MRASRERQLDWLKKALEKTGLSPNALAEKARVNPSTLYRFLNGANERGLRDVTVNRIAKVAQLEPPYSGGAHHGDARIYDIDRLPDISRPGDHEPDLAAVEVRNGAMALAHICSGDFLVVDRRRKPQAGDIVCAEVYDFRLGAAETVIRFYEPPYLVAASDDVVFRKPLLLDNDKVQIIGVVVRQIRVRDFIEAA